MQVEIGDRKRADETWPLIHMSSDSSKIIHTDIGSKTARAGYGTFKVPVRQPEPRTWFEHKVRPGDTLAALAVKYDVHIEDITRAHGTSGMGAHRLLLRETLRIPVPADRARELKLTGSTDEHKWGELHGYESS